MRKSDTWPGGVAMESLSNMDSAGSCDSVISMNSGYSEDSMEHLSAEERACLMYLEETIEALEVQEDSGLSNDEPDPVSQAGKMGQMDANDISSFKSESGRDQKSFLSYAVPTPLASLSAEPGSQVVTIQEKAEHHALNETSEPQSSPASAANMKETSMNLTAQVKPPVTESVALSTDEDGTLKAGLDQASEIDLSLIPPPSDFMDEPDPLPQPEKAQDPLPPAEISNNKPGIDLEQLRQRASAKRHSVSPPVTLEPPTKPPELSPLPAHSSAQMSPPEAAEPKSPPAVAPKPKKLPPNIILKSHKAAGADGISGHSVPATSDRLMLDPRRVHMEALRKLGLLKSDEMDASPIPSPKLSPKTRKSWAAPPSPISPAAPYTPPSTPSDTHVNSPSAASVPLQSPAAVSPTGSSTAPAVLPPVILPAPAAFSDPDGPLLSDDEPSAVRDVSQATVNAQVNTPPLTPPALVKQPTPPKVKGIKSATLERSGMGLSSYMASQDSNEAGYGVIGKQSPSELRNSRPRPASLGNGKEFSSTQGAASQVGHATSKEADTRRSLPAVQHSGDSQKLPRSQGISVLICPRAENGDNRREALKRLGLLRD